MAEPLRTFFDRRLVERLAGMLASVDLGFPTHRFVAEAADGLDCLGLMDRARQIASAMRRTLPRDFPSAIDRLIASLGPELGRTEGIGMEPFLYLPHVLLVAEHGLEHFEPSMRAQYELTKRFTAEFSIRAFVDRYPAETLARLRAWTADPNVHVRRLVSEGTRPRLPWAPQLRAFRQDPRPVLELLERLRDDPERYVIRSVANNLNDIGKDHPELLLEVCARWLHDATPQRRWLVRHALRSLVRRGDPAALGLLGFRAASSLRVEASVRPARICLGQDIEVSVTVRNDGARPQRAAIGVVVHFVKADGRSRPRTFKIRPLELGPRTSATACKRISFARMTTRRHYAGRHRLEAVVNGRPVPIGYVDVSST